jgi:hypothetical protein
MSAISRAFNYLQHNPLQFVDSCVKNLGFLFPDKLYLSLRFRCQMGKWIDWKNPKIFNEKLQWLKVYNRRPEYTAMVDKAEAKHYAASIIGEEHIIPTLGVWDRFDEIDFSRLPDKFVLKTTNGGGGGGVVICRDKSTFDKGDAKKKLEQSLHSSIYRTFREWPYKNVKPRIIAEQYMTDSLQSDELVDYKFYCFEGEPKLIMVSNGRNSGNKHFGYYDLGWNTVDITWGAPRPMQEFSRPDNLDEMLRIASELSKKLVHARVDLYNIDSQTYFGEVTFFDGSGFQKITPVDYDEYLGSLMQLPKSSLGGGKILIANENVVFEPSSSVASELRDYKFFCVNGTAHNVMLCYDRQSGDTKFYFFDRDWNLLRLNKRGLAAPADFSIPKPKAVDEMFRIAGELSKGLPFARVDLYDVNGKIYFGEITFYPQSGFDANLLPDTDRMFGDLIELPQN